MKWALVISCLPWIRYLLWMIHVMQFAMDFISLYSRMLTLCSDLMVNDCVCVAACDGTPLSSHDPVSGQMREAELMTPGPHPSHNHNWPSSEQTWWQWQPVITESNLLPGVLLCTPETRVIYARSYFSQLRWTSKWIIMTRHDSNHLLARANCQCQCTILFWS